MKIKVTLVAALAVAASLAAVSNAAAVVSPELQAALGVFRAAPALYPVSPDQTPPSDVFDGQTPLPANGTGADLAAARGVNALITGGQVVLVPSTEGVCFGTPNLKKNGGGYGCYSLKEVLAGKALFWSSNGVNLRKHPATITGVMPDSVHYVTFVTFHGDRIKVPTHDNVIEAEINGFKSYIVSGHKYSSGYTPPKAKHHTGK
ncbi:MAG: hypothetical protein JHC87_07990 [Thermoleophilaceae bacterium]|nr:hypothetical protein [Thermoleophilaceae bacterium]